MVKAAGLELFRGFGGSRGWILMAEKSQGGSGVVGHPCKAKSSHSLHIHPPCYCISSLIPPLGAQQTPP